MSTTAENPEKELSLDDKVKAQLKMLSDKKNELSKIERPNWVTDCLFKFSNSPVSTDIRNANTNDLFKIARFLIKENDSHEKATELLGMKNTFEWFNYSFEDWVSDLKLRMKILRKSELLKQIECLEKDTYDILTPAQKRELKAESITSKVDELLAGF